MKIEISGFTEEIARLRNQKLLSKFTPVIEALEPLKNFDQILGGIVELIYSLNNTNKMRMKSYQLLDKETDTLKKVLTKFAEVLQAKGLTLKELGDLEG